MSIPYPSPTAYDILSSVTVAGALVSRPALRRFAMRNPPIKKKRASRPRITARVTMAPMTPATARDISPELSVLDELDDPELEEEEVEDAHSPSVLPHI